VKKQQLLIFKNFKPVDIGDNGDKKNPTPIRCGIRIIFS
jgi:hypothetical protein